MTRASYLFFCLTFLFSGLQSISALGINCRGSGLCPFAAFTNKLSESVIQGLRDAIYQSSAPDSTTFNNGDHVICVGTSLAITLSLGYGPVTLTLAQGKLGDGGICLFPQDMKSGSSLTLGQIKPLMDAILLHGCTTCGSVPIHFVDEGSNDPSDGILTFNYVGKPVCTGSCISGSGQSGGSSGGGSSGGGSSGGDGGAESSPAVSTVTVINSGSAPTATGAAPTTTVTMTAAATSSLPASSSSIAEPAETTTATAGMNTDAGSAPTVTVTQTTAATRSSSANSWIRSVDAWQRAWLVVLALVLG